MMNSQDSRAFDSAAKAVSGPPPADADDAWRRNQRPLDFHPASRYGYQVDEKKREQAGREVLQALGRHRVSKDFAAYVACEAKRAMFERVLDRDFHWEGFAFKGLPDDESHPGLYSKARGVRVLRPVSQQARTDMEQLLPPQIDAMMVGVVEVCRLAEKEGNFLAAIRKARESWPLPDEKERLWRKALGSPKLWLTPLDERGFERSIERVVFEVRGSSARPL